MNPITPADLSTFLGLSSVDEDRAQMLIDDAFAQACAVATVGTVPAGGPAWANLPAGAAGVLRAAVARLYLNPAGVTAETTGPFSSTRPAPTGSLFSKAEIATLKRLAGVGGAFTVDPTPSDAGTDLYLWDENVWNLDPEASDLLFTNDDDSLGEWL